jgi:hypothetical protein
VGDPEPRLRPLRDVVQLLVNHRVDSDRVVQLAHRWGMAVLVARAIDQAVDLLGIDVDPHEHPLVPWAARYRPTRAEARRLHCYVGLGSSYVRRVLGSLRELPDARARAEYALAMVRPERDAVDTPISDRMRRATATLVDGGTARLGGRG